MKHPHPHIAVLILLVLAGCAHSPAPANTQEPSHAVEEPPGLVLEIAEPFWAGCELTVLHVSVRRFATPSRMRESLVRVWVTPDAEGRVFIPALPGPAPSGREQPGLRAPGSYSVRLNVHPSGLSTRSAPVTLPIPGPIEYPGGRMLIPVDGRWEARGAWVGPIERPPSGPAADSGIEFRVGHPASARFPCLGDHVPRFDIESDPTQVQPRERDP